MRSANKLLLLLSGVAAVTLAIPAISQQTPESELLPPGFGDPDEPPPSVEPTPTPSATPTGTETPTPGQRSVDSFDGIVESAGFDDLEALEDLIPKEPPLEIPDASRRPAQFVGAIDDQFGL